MKNYEYYAKLVFALRWKKVDKLLEKGEEQEKLWLVEALGAAAKGGDEGYNHLVEALQGAKEKPIKLAAIKAMGACGRPAAVSQLSYVADHDEDPEVKQAALDAIHAARG